MISPDLISAITALFIVGMIWLRTRMQYPRSGKSSLQLERTGQIYFGCAIGLLAIGWAAAPVVGRALWPQAGATPTLMRVVWFLATYYLFIIAHRIMKSRGIAVFK